MTVGIVHPVQISRATSTHDGVDQQALRIDEDVAFLALDLPTSVVPLRQVLRHRAPPAAGGQNLHDPVHDLADVHRTLVAAAFGRRDQRLDELPFLVGQIARVAQMAAIVSSAISPSSTSAVPSNQAAFVESQTFHMIQELIGQTLTSMGEEIQCQYPDREQPRYYHLIRLS